MNKLFLLAVFLLNYIVSPAQNLDIVAPEAVGLDASRLANADRAIAQAIADKTIPGAVLCVERHGKIGYLKAHGNKRVYPNTEKMTTGTVFDMASCSKAMSTATCAMILEGQHYGRNRGHSRHRFDDTHLRFASIRARSRAEKEVRIAESTGRCQLD